MRALGIDIDGIDRLTGRYKEAIASRTAKGEVCNSFGDQDQADPFRIIGSVHVNAIVARSIPAGGSPNVAVHIRLNAIGTNNFVLIRRVSKNFAIGQRCFVFDIKDHNVGIGGDYVELGKIGGETEAIGAIEFIRHDGNFAAVGKVRRSRRWGAAVCIALLWGAMTSSRSCKCC